MKKGLKIVTIGGGSSYTPELVEGFIKRYDDLTVKELWFVDIEEGKEKFAALTKEVSESDSQTMYIYMDKDYENAFSQPTVSEENTMGYTFISGASIVSKSPVLSQSEIVAFLYSEA